MDRSMNRIEQIKTRLNTTLLCIVTLTAPNLYAAEDLLIANAKRELKIERRYLHLPIKNGAPKRVVTTLVDGRVEEKNDIELANAEPDWWAFIRPIR